MIPNIFQALKNGVQRIIKHPQLAYTIAAGVAVAVAFVGLTSWFIDIAYDAHESLVNERIGSIHDAFVQFVPEHLDEQDALRQKMQQIADINHTIDSFYIVKAQSGEAVIDVALDKELEGGSLQSPEPRTDEKLLSFARSDPNQSYVNPPRDGGEFYTTVRAVTDHEGEVIAYTYTTHQLSAAEQVITNRLQNAIIVFILVIILVLGLFLRHSRIIDYAQLYKRLKEVDQMKDDFISMASHELRTPLTHIRGYVDMLKGRQDIADETEEKLDKIDSQAQQLDGLVADMLDVKRLEQGRMTFENETMQPHEVITDVIEESQHDAEEKGLELSAQIAKKAPIYADPSRLKQVLINLVGNAVKYTDKGDEITVKQYVEGENLVIRVHDTGQGMSAEERDQLFQKFSRVGSKSQQKHIKGTGLGLWITKQIVEQMQGAITVESIEGVGSDFIVEFPMTHDDAQESVSDQ